MTLRLRLLRGIANCQVFFEVQLRSFHSNLSCLCVFDCVCYTVCSTVCVQLWVSLCVHRKVNNYYTFLILGGKFDCSFSACKVLSAVQLWFKLDSANSASDSVRFWFCQFCLRFCHTGFLNGLGQWKSPRSFFRLKWGVFEGFEEKLKSWMKWDDG